MTRHYYDFIDDSTGEVVTGAWLTEEQAVRGSEQHGTRTVRYRLAETRYADDQGRETFVSMGISGQFREDACTYAVYRRKPNGSLQRVQSPALPLRLAHAAAQSDLDAYVARKGWQKIN
jgi:hypothetical protein